MQIADGIETGKEYYWKRSAGWQWNDRERWWEVFVEFDGLNGAGGAWLREKWRWNGSQQTIYNQPRSLSYQETAEIIEQIKTHNTGDER